MHKCLVHRMVLLLMLSSCSAKKQTYNIERHKSLTGRTFIYGQIIGNHGKALPATVIQSLKKENKTQADKDGNYLLEITDSSKEIKALWIGYLTYKTKGLKIIAGDSVHVDIQLIESDDVLID